MNTRKSYCMETEAGIKHPVFVGNFSTYSCSWCRTCERVGLTQDWPGSKARPFCDASLQDQWHWEQVRQTNAEYPIVPTIGNLYLLYGNTSKG